MAHDRGAKDPPALPDNRLEESYHVAFGLGPIVLSELRAEHTNVVAMNFPGRGFGQADLGEFRIGVRHPRERFGRVLGGKRNNAFRSTIPA